MSINGSGSTFIPFTLSGLTSITASNSNIGDATATSLTMTTATPNKIARFNGSQQLVSSTVDVSDIAVLGANNTFSTGFTNNLNGAIKTVNNPLAINNAGINAETISAIVPSTYTLVSGFYRFVSPSSLTGSMQFPNAFTYGTTSLQKYILTLTNCSTNGTDPVTATVYNATTGLIISDATQTITSTAETVTFTFMTGTSPSIIYLNFSAGAINYFVQWSALSVQQCNTEVLGNLVLDAPIISNMTQSPGTTTNLAGGLLVSQTSTGVSASTFTQTGMPASAPTSTLTFSSPTYTLTATGSFATWLGAGTTYITGAKYTFNFGSMFGSQALQLQVVQYNALGSAYVDVGDIPYSVSKTSSTISGSFTAGLNASYLGSIVFFFTPTSFSQNVKFNTFTMTRADTQITGVTTLPTNAGTAVSGIGLNASNQIVTTAVPTNFSAVTVGYVPYESATDTFSNSLISQGTTGLGYTGASFTASTGIASITFSSPTYSANSNASFQGIITLPALPSSVIGLPCIATITASAFPVFAVAPYPYFTLTNGATVVYTSPIGSPGTVSMPFTPTSTTLFITIYFKAPPTGFTGSVFTWTNFVITTPSMTTTGFSNTTGNLNVSGATTIGTVANTVALTVNQSGTVPTVQFNSSAPDSCIDLNCTATSGRKYRIGSAGTGTGAGVGNFFIYDATASLPRMVIDSIGKMGLGTTAPSFQLHLYNDGTNSNILPRILVESASTANGYNATLLLKTGTNSSSISTGGSGNLNINANTPGVKWVAVGSDNASKLSAGVADPESFIGFRKFIVAGTSGNSDGGHVAYYTTSDYYPLYQQLNWTHDNIFQGYDMYYDGAFRMGATGTGYAFYKQGNAFRLYVGSGSQGNGTGLTTAIEVNANSAVLLPQQPFVIVGAVGGASIGYGAGTNFGSGGYLFAYTSAGYSNTPGSGWASVAGRFWATLLGRYQVNFCFYWNNFSAGSRAVMLHYDAFGNLLETRYCALWGAGIGSDTTQNYSTIVYMSAGSYLQFQFQSGSGTLYFGGITHTHCSFHFLG